jgi:Holliday junction resolvasome RuvABC endonuclease subunit
MRTYLGVDQSLRSTGIVVLDDAGQILIQQAVATKQLRDVARLAAIRSAVQDALVRFRPCRAALEGYSYDSTGKVFQLGEAGGMVKLAFWDARVPFLTVAPAQLKKYVANNHQASKELMLQRTREKWAVDFGDADDVCDAHGLAHIMRAIDVKDTKLRNELEVIHELLSPAKKPALTSKTAKSKISVSI